ncbi:hypothetical protein AABM38_20155 [Heyndrickxia sp. MSNUG]|uniref:hypothetical protein n=1 Tax=Heyndrickxia sp. MSNUG TaxID=3136677 RepID=UPI003C2D3A7B
MDDQLLEKRLESLRKAYLDMHEEENRSEILAAIKKDQKRKKQNKWFHLPYAASFIGVGMIAGVLMMQYIDDIDLSASEKPGINETSGDSSEKKGELTESEVKEKITALQAYYTERQTYTKENLGLGAGYEQFFYQNILDDIAQFEAEVLENPEAINRGEFERKSKEIKNAIAEAFTMPSEIMEKLSQGAGNHQYDRGDEYNLLGQLESYWGAYLQSLVLYEGEINKALEKASVADVVEKLNAGGEGISTPGLKRLAEGAVRNGYAFRAEDGKIEIYIDYLSVAERLKPETNPDFIYYLELKSNRVQDSQGNVLSYKNLGQLLVKHEKGVKIVQDPTIEQWMKIDVQSLYALFVKGHPAKPLFTDNKVLKEEVKSAYRYVIDTYPDTDTGAAVKIFYDQLEKNNFKQDPEFSMRAVIFPKYMNIKTPDKSEIMITQSILPLTAEMESAYEEFSAKKDVNILRNYSAFQVMQLYFYSDEVKDYATKYALYSQKDALPSEEQYISEQQAAEMKLSTMLEEYDHASLYYSEKNSDLITGIQLHFKERADAPVFQMVQEDGIWKIRYMPLQ